MTRAPLTVTPVGVGAAVGRPQDVQSCHLVRAGDIAIGLDLGAGALNRLSAHIAPHRLDLLVVSHLHPDHCADLLALRVYMRWGPGVGYRLPVWGPPGLRERLVAFAGGDDWDEAFAFSELAEGSRPSPSGVPLTFREVPHLPPTHAVRVDVAGRALVYGADCGDNDALADLATGSDVLLCECTMGLDPVPDGVPHLNADSAGRIAARAGVGRLLLTHCPPGHDRHAVLARAREVAGLPVDWAQADAPVVV